MEEQKFKVLVVDDDPGIVKVIGIILSTHGHEVIKAHNGNEGLELAGREKPDVILLDIMMPDIDGYEVIKRLKGNPDTAQIPVIFVTAKTTPDAIQQGRSLGAAAYIIKPFNPETLLEKINEACKPTG